MRYIFSLFMFIVIVVFASSAYAEPCASVERELAYGEAASEDAEDKSGFFRAAKEFKKATAKAPDCPKAFFYLGQAAAGAGDLKVAKAAYERFIQLVPATHQEVGWVRKQIYKLEYRISRATEQKKKRPEQRSVSDNLNALSGTWTARQKDNPTLSSIYDPPKLSGLWESATHRANVSVSNDRVIVTIRKYPGMFVFNGAVKGNKISGRLTMQDNSGICPHLPRDYPFDGKIMMQTGHIILSTRGATAGIEDSCANDPNAYVWSFLLSR